MSFRKAYGALKDTTKVGLAKVNSEFKDLDIAIVKATNHVELPPKERHIRKIFSATSLIRPRADVAYCIHTLSKRLSKTKSWIVALKTLIVIHRTLREGDPTFREELLNYSHRGHVLQISNFKDDSSPLAWDCSAWVRTYAQYLEERLECFRVLKYDIESERLTKNSPGSHKVHSKTRILNGEQLLKQLPALQQLMYRLISCHPEGAAYTNHLIQYALALVLKESFKVYCAINDGIINLVDVFFDMSKHDAIKALNIYKRAGQQAENLADLYDHCRSLEMARNFQFPTLRQPPPSFLQTMEEYIKEAPQTGSVNNRLEYQEQELIDNDEQEEPKENHRKPVEDKEEMVKTEDEAQPKEEVEEPPFIATEEDKDTEGDLLGFAAEINPKALELEESNALALAILPNGNEQSSTFSDLSRLHDSEWELALVTAPNNNSNTNRASQPKLGGGFDKLLLDSLYEDDSARRNLQIQNSGYGLGHGYEMSVPNPFEQQAQVHDPFMMSNNFAPPTNVQMELAQQQHQQMLSRQQQQQFYPQQQNMVPYNYQFVQQHMQPTTSNPFGDPFSFPTSTAQLGNQNHGGLI